jgi:hypothetical protein
VVDLTTKIYEIWKPIADSFPGFQLKDQLAVVKSISLFGQAYTTRGGFGSRQSAPLDSRLERVISGVLGFMKGQLDSRWNAEVLTAIAQAVESFSAGNRGWARPPRAACLQMTAAGWQTWHAHSFELAHVCCGQAHISWPRGREDGDPEALCESYLHLPILLPGPGFARHSRDVFDTLCAVLADPNSPDESVRAALSVPTT